MEKDMLSKLKRCIFFRPNGEVEWIMCTVNEANVCHIPPLKEMRKDGAKYPTKVWQCFSLSPYEITEIQNKYKLNKANTNQ
jgi:hypothetical protein